MSATSTPAFESAVSSTQRPSDALWNRIGAGFGLATVGLFVANIVIEGSKSSELDTDPAQSGDVIARVLVENADAARLSASVIALTVVCFVCFTGYLYRRVQIAEAGRSWIAPVVLGSGLLAGGVLLTWSLLALASSLDFGADPAVARTLATIMWDSILLLGAPLAAFVGASAVAGLRYGALPRPLCWLGLPVVALLIVQPVAFFGVVLFVVWLLAASAVLTARPQLPSRRTNER
jgi:hypothetical protein